MQTASSPVSKEAANTLQFMLVRWIAHSGQVRECAAWRVYEFAPLPPSLSLPPSLIPPPHSPSLLQPFSVVESPYFQDFVKALRPAYDLPTRRGIVIGLKQVRICNTKISSRRSRS
jgi:hypothetical protein